MKNIINQLCQLQDLILVRDEHRATGDGEHLDRLNQSIDEMTDSLPTDVKTFFTRLLNKDHAVMAPVHNGCCAVCGMRLPISQVQSVRQCKQLQTCPGCARILFEELDAPQRVGVQQSKVDIKKSGISRFSAETLMVPDLLASSADDAIEILAGKMEEASFVSHADKLINAAKEREAMLSTAMGNGLAFPHVRGVEGGSLTFACGVSKQPFEYDADGTPVNIVFLITIPAAVSAFYLRLIAVLSEAFMKESNRKALIAADTPSELWKALNKVTRYSFQTK